MSYLVEVSYQVDGVTKHARIGVDGHFPDVLTIAADSIVNHRSLKGEVLTNVSASVVEVR